jgi:hypothetical protein
MSGTTALASFSTRVRPLLIPTSLPEPPEQPGTLMGKHAFPIPTESRLQMTNCILIQVLDTNPPDTLVASTHARAWYDLSTPVQRSTPPGREHKIGSLSLDRRLRSRSQAVIGRFARRQPRFCDGLSFMAPLQRTADEYLSIC